MKQSFTQLKGKLTGAFHEGETMRKLYATDASVYRELPLAVAIPDCEGDIQALIEFANENGCVLIPRAAGTSLAGQVVGSGIVLDISKHFTKILEVNAEEKWVRLQPGVIRNELNAHLKPYGLFFGPETSTQNRAMIGGMVGNNSCGSNSIVCGTTRDHLLETKGFLSDGSRCHFKSLSNEEFQQKTKGDSNKLETSLYRQINDFLSNLENRKRITENFPHPAIHRRNTGYAIDALMEMNPFTDGGDDFNFCKLLAGSEGTLSFLTEVKLNLLPLPPAASGLVCIHFKNVDEALRANLIALEYNPRASELIDHYILDCTKKNISQQKNRFFVQGEPGAILVVELSGESEEEVIGKCQKMEAEMRAAGYGYHFPLLFGEDSNKVWELRKAGLGLLSNIPGDAKPVALIEDAAVDVHDLPEYIKRLNANLKRHNLDCVHYAHAGSGEIHIRPILDLKDESDRKLFRTVGEETAALVKEFRGSLSGEHGDGRLRGEFIKGMIGDENFQALKALKKTWDPKGVFNPGKITDAPPMDQNLRYQVGQKSRKIDTILDFSKDRGILRAAEMCNGSGDCRKTQAAGGTMCPSYMATREEKDTTRARANILREVLTNSDAANPFDSEEIKEVMDLCLSCKGCKSECPSSVDVAKFKAEFLQHYYDANGIPMRTKMIAEFTRLSEITKHVAPLYNLAFNIPILSGLLKQSIGFAKQRSIPKSHSLTLRAWFNKQYSILKAKDAKDDLPLSIKTVYLFCDEFTNYNDVEIGKKAVKLLVALGYEVVMPKHGESGRTWLSKGLLRQARLRAQANVQTFSKLITDESPLIGIEPSAILTFRDEYPDLLRGEEQATARAIAPNVLMLEEFIDNEIKLGNISRDQFTDSKQEIKLHGHCQQKAVASLTPTLNVLSYPKNYTVTNIPSGCCGMAGSFGYEKEHYDISMKIGELVLFPAVRNASTDTLIAASGTSCRHQIHDGCDKQALHPIEILYNALK